MHKQPKPDETNGKKTERTPKNAQEVINRHLSDFRLFFEGHSPFHHLGNKS